VTAAIELIGTVGPLDGPRVFVLYTGGTIGMSAGPDGALMPLDLRELAVHLPAISSLPIGLTLATFVNPLDSSAMAVDDWVDIADAIVEHSPGHVGVVVLHGTDTMAYTASALSFVLDGIDVPIVVTGSQRPITATRSDGRENLVTALEMAAGHVRGDPLVPEVTIFFADVLLRGNRAIKVHADSYHGFDSPNHAPLATAGVSIDFDTRAIRAPGVGPIRRTGDLSPDVSALRLYPSLDEATLRAVLERPGLRGVILEAYGAGNGPSDRWFLDAVHDAVVRGVTVVVVTQCRAGGVHDGLYATGAALLAAGAIAGGDMTFEAALTKLMALAARYDRPDEVARLMRHDLAGELTLPDRSDI
jgi:L-asparaginase